MGSSDDTGTSSGAPPQIDHVTCSDGVLGQSEPCDDANDIPGDGCNPGCFPSGVELDFSIWLIDWTPTALALDSAEMAWISGFDSFDSMVMTYDRALGFAPNVELLDVEQARVAFAPGGQLIVAGQRDGETYLERRTRGGTVLWTRTHPGAFDVGDLFVDDDRIALTGSTWPHAAASYDVHVAVFDRDGEALWNAGYNGPFDGTQAGREIVADEAGDIYVVGVDKAARGLDGTQAGARDTDVWLRKYDSVGEMLWTQHHDGLAGDVDEPFGAAISTDGDVLVVGFETTNDGARVIELTARFAPNGAPWWIATHDRGGADSSVVRCAAFAGNGDAAIAGTIAGAEGRSYFVARIDASGATLWERQRDALGDDVGPFDIAIAEGSGDVVVVGFDRDRDYEPLTWVWRTSG